ncbi:DUF2306 domain-containing protein [Phreatobacter stygius]|uniref:DUF2306 domain-containing protein n=1 Tax=Phreatobacter stygius TaxID=1940610 RepID=A0A4D7BLX9_9HYPH|nr:DUF2306 domain-containing protein [Phreatobacter stygius]QCI68727.1 DUF2306 domain-containing protein [Phreatobacter stygius]
MTLAPLLAAPVMIQIHAIAALALIPLTLAQFMRRKGGSAHRVLGWSWVVLMAIVAISSFWIHSIRLIGPFSPIHILSLITLFGLFGAIIARRRGDIARHRRIMMMVTGGWVAAGLFAFLPGRVMAMMTWAG